LTSFPANLPKRRLSADLLRVGGDLGQLASLLISSGRPHEAVLAQQAMVEILEAHTPPADRLLDYRIMLAEARHNLIARLINDQQIEPAAVLVSAAITAYRDYIALPGADLLRVGGDLGQLASLLISSGRPHEAEQVREAAAEIAPR
jgi:hypothetical protein